MDDGDEDDSDGSDGSNDGGKNRDDNAHDDESSLVTLSELKMATHSC